MAEVLLFGLTLGLRDLPSQMLEPSLVNGTARTGKYNGFYLKISSTGKYHAIVFTL